MKDNCGQIFFIKKIVISGQREYYGKKFLDALGMPYRLYSQSIIR